MKQKITGYVVLLFFLSIMSYATANQVGLSGIWYASPYTGDKNETVPWPIVRLDTNHFFIDNGTGGIHLWRDTDQQVNALIQFLPLHLNPSKNRNEQMKQLDHRRTRLLGGLGYQLVTDMGTMNAAILADMPNTSQSVIADLTYTYRGQVMRDLFISPFIGANWVNKKHNQYYFGVSTSESARTGIRCYRPNDGVGYYIGIGMDYFFTPHWSGKLDYQFFKFNHKAKSSPITKHDYSHLLVAGVAFNF